MAQLVPCRSIAALGWHAAEIPPIGDWVLSFPAVTVDLVQVRTVVRQQGDAVHAILESINLPIVARPILRDGMALVDGGVLNNLPADVLAESGVDFVVGVDVSSRVRSEFAGNRPDMPTVKMKHASALDTLFRIFESQAHNMGKLRNRAVDFWIKPDTSSFGLAAFHRTTVEPLARHSCHSCTTQTAAGQWKSNCSSGPDRWRRSARARLAASRLVGWYHDVVTTLASCSSGSSWSRPSGYFGDSLPRALAVAAHEVPVLRPLVVVGASLVVLPLVPWATQGGLGCWRSRSLGSLR